MPTVALIAEQLRRPVSGGIGTYVRGLRQGLATAETGDLGVRVWQSRLPVRVRSRLWDRGLGRIGADLVHAPSFAFPRPRRSPLVVVVHDLAWRDAPETFPERGREWHEGRFQRALRDATRLVVPSSAVAERVIAAGAAAAQVTVIEEGCDHLPPPDEAAAAAVVDGPYILTVGTREPRKNLARLAEAYSMARHELTDPPAFVVVGPAGWGHSDHLGDAVVTGPVAPAVLAGLYRGATAFAYVPLVEGFGLPPVEAMHAGVPVVTSTAVPSGGGATVEVDPMDVGAIADALVRVVTDDTLRADLVTRGAARAAQLTWSAAAQAHVELWRSLLG